MILSRHHLTKPRIQALILIIAVIAVYLPAISAEISLIDDYDMLQAFAQKDTWSFKDYFVPQQPHGLYYRPLTLLTYLADKLFFQQNPLIMHSINILLHAANCLLVFLFTKKIASFDERSLSPFYVGLIFALHPLATESTNWISGRTDLLAGCFCMASTVFLFKHLEQKQICYAVCAAMTFLFAILSKESAIAALPGILLLASARKTSLQNRSDHVSLLTITAIMVIAAAVFFLLRAAAFTSPSSRIGITFMVMSTDPWYSLFICLRAFGYYLTKMLVPAPLNFAIVEVDPLYELLAIPLSACCLWIATQRSLLSASWTTGILLMTPSLLIAFGQIAWTPYAERYMYLPLMFLIPSGLLFLEQHMIFPNAYFTRKTFAALLALAFAGITLERNFVWQTNESLVTDTLHKSPGYAQLWYVNAGIQYNKGRLEAAIDSAKKASELTHFPYNEKHDLLFAALLTESGRYDEAMTVYTKIIKKTGGASTLARERTKQLTERRSASRAVE